MYKVVPHQKSLSAPDGQTVEPTVTLEDIHKLISLCDVIKISVVSAVSAKSDVIYRKGGMLVIVFDYVGIELGASVKFLGGII